MSSFTEKFRRRTPCPYCGKETIGYWHKIRCWSLSDTRCPECGAVIRHEKIYRIIDILIIIGTLIGGFLIIDRSADIFWGGSIGLLLLPALIYRHTAVFFSRLDYDEDASHPKNGQ